MYILQLGDIVRSHCLGWHLDTQLVLSFDVFRRKGITEAMFKLHSSIQVWTKENKPKLNGDKIEEIVLFSLQFNRREIDIDKNLN